MSKTITVFDDDGRPVQMFRAPADKYAARSLWVFLVDNLRPGLTVQLAIDDGAGDGAAEITRSSGRKVTAELYASLMDGET